MAEANVYGGFWIRLLAYIVDSLIVGIAFFLIVALLTLMGLELISPTVIYFALFLLYWALMQSSARQATYGKSLVGLKVTGYGGERISFLRALAREAAKIISTLTLLIGFVIAAFTNRKQALHDFMASTYVVRESPGHVVAAAAVALVALVAPVIAVVLLGAGMIATVMGGMAAAMMGGMAPEITVQVPKPATPPPPQAATQPPAPAPAAAPPTPAPVAKVAAAPAPAAPVAKAPAAPAVATKFVGSWTNEDPKTRSITRVEIAADGAGLKIHMWGRCQPTDCDWGEVSGPAKDAEGGTLSPTWITNFSVNQQQITLLPDGKLQVKGNVRYTDKSGRAPRAYTDRFVLATARTAPAAAQAPAKPAPVRVAATPPPAAAEPAVPKEKPKPAAEPRQPRAAAPAPAAAPVQTAAPAVPTLRFNDLVTAVLYRDTWAVNDLLAFGKWPDKPDSRGMTPLMLAAMLGDVASAEALLKAGANPNRPGPGGDTAVSIAREQKDAPMQALLQRYGAR